MKVSYGFWRIGALAAVLLSLAATSALAQRGMGYGGMGMGRGMHHGMQGGAIWSVPGVPDSSLTAEQRQRISGIRQDTQARVQSLRRNTSLSQQERDRQVGEARLSGHRRVMAVLTPAQRQQVASAWQECCGMGMGGGPGMGRGAGMHRGMGGGPGMRGAMWSVPGVPDSSLTSEQRQRIAAIRQETQRQVQSISTNTGLSESERERQINEARLSGHRQVMDVLTPEQRQQAQDWWQRR